MSKLGWSDLPEELVDLIANRVSSSHIDLLRSRSICKPWRSVIATKKRVFYRFQRNLPHFKKKKTVLAPTSFSRVTLPSSRPNKGWLIKTTQVSESSKINCLSPLSGKVITPCHQNLDLLNLGVSEIRQSYNVQYFCEEIFQISPPRARGARARGGRARGVRARDVSICYKFFAKSSRVVLVQNMFFAVDYDNEIWCCKGGEESSEWRSIKNEEVKNFSDIIVHKGQIYALDLKGVIWWISLSELELYQYRPLLPVEDYYNDIFCKEKRLVEYCGDLCIFLRLCKKFCVKGRVIERTIGFKVYKMDENLVEWVNLSSLGDKTLIISMDSCFMVPASEYYGCLKNAIYFTDEGEDYKVFKLDDGSIINMTDSSFDSCFQMFSNPFLRMCYHQYD